MPLHLVACHKQLCPCAFAAAFAHVDRCCCLPVPGDCSLACFLPSCPLLRGRLMFVTLGALSCSTTSLAFHVMAAVGLSHFFASLASTMLGNLQCSCRRLPMCSGSITPPRSCTPPEHVHSHLLRARSALCSHTQSRVARPPSSILHPPSACWCGYSLSLSHAVRLALGISSNSSPPFVTARQASGRLSCALHLRCPARPLMAFSSPAAFSSLRASCTSPLPNALRAGAGIAHMQV